MPNNSSPRRTPVNKRQGIKIDLKIRKLYEQRNRTLDNDSESAPLHPGKWASAMRRDEYLRPVKKQTTVRIDVEVLALA